MNDNHIKQKTFELISLAHELASDTIGFTSKRMAELLDSDDHKQLKDMTVEDTMVFMITFMNHINEAYDVQLNSLGANLLSNEEKVQKNKLQ